MFSFFLKNVKNEFEFLISKFKQKNGSRGASLSPCLYLLIVCMLKSCIFLMNKIHTNLMHLIYEI